MNSYAPVPADPVIRLRGVTKTYRMGKDNVVQALQGADLDVYPGEFVALMGPSGSGKSTMMNILGCLDVPEAGTYVLAGEQVRQLNDDQLAAIRNKHIGFVFQTFNLLPRLNAIENVELPLLYGGSARGRTQRAKDALAAVGLGERMHHKPNELSGGQQQRVAVARALVLKPDVLLFDEPLSNLDASLRVHMRVEIARLHEELGKTMIYVTHDQVEAMTLADRIVVLNGGHIEQVGSPLELYRAPDNMFVAGFIGSPKMNFLEAVPDSSSGRIRLHSGDTVQVVDDRGARASHARVTLGIRPEHLSLAAPERDNTVRGTVKLVEHLGDVSYLHVALDGYELPLMMRAAPDTRERAGDVVAVHLPPSQCHVFDAQGKVIIQAPGV
jgi:multiple sugar transport system ATP-binding protein